MWAEPEIEIKNELPRANIQICIMYKIKSNTKIVFFKWNEAIQRNEKKRARERERDRQGEIIDEVTSQSAFYFAHSKLRALILQFSVELNISYNNQHKIKSNSIYYISHTFKTIQHNHEKW